MASEAIFTIYDLPVAKTQSLLGRNDLVRRFCTHPAGTELSDRDHHLQEKPDVVQRIKSAKDQTKAIVDAALDRNNPSELWRATVPMLVSVLGAKTGNFVLKVFAPDGVYIAGGAALHLIDILREPRFMHAFLNKGRFNNLMSRIPVPVITARAALVGAASYGLETLERHKGTA